MLIFPTNCKDVSSILHHVIFGVRNTQQIRKLHLPLNDIQFYQNQRKHKETVFL
jgi:hypothetical protein